MQAIVGHFLSTWEAVPNYNMQVSGQLPIWYTTTLIVKFIIFNYHLPLKWTKFYSFHDWIDTLCLRLKLALWFWRKWLLHFFLILPPFGKRHSHDIFTKNGLCGTGLGSLLIYHRDAVLTFNKLELNKGCLEVENANRQMQD